MFGKGSEVTSGDKHGHSILQEGMVVEGTLEAKGDVRLDGRLIGKVVVSERLTIGASGVLHAEVEAGEAIIMGTVEGSVRAQRRLELRKGARVVGDIASPILMIEEGVHFHGNCNMRSGDSAATGLDYDPLASKVADGSTETGRFEKIYQ